MAKRAVIGLSAAVMTTALALGADVAVLVHRPARVDIAMPSTSSPTAGETWLILGTDSRATVPGDQSRYTFYKIRDTFFFGKDGIEPRERNFSLYFYNLLGSISLLVANSDNVIRLQFYSFCGDSLR